MNKQIYDIADEIARLNGFIRNTSNVGIYRWTYDKNGVVFGLARDNDARNHPYLFTTEEAIRLIHQVKYRWWRPKCLSKWQAFCKSGKSVEVPDTGDMNYDLWNLALKCAEADYREQK